MNNEQLYRDYLIRAEGRLKALETLFNEALWADVVRESQEVVELSLKGLLRYMRVEVPRIHDVSGVLEANEEKLPSSIKKSLGELVDISQDLRRDRELAFYGSEDITPHEFYKKKHAQAAKDKARRVVELCKMGVGL
ncbi:MAG: HEPN domain-containing protein [SAR324 cluster bacterium]|uniref:HEPN domain-containing protein n=1 Tax=SAR324 cluster bacterium TaxID=2024889 RepID=A0A7X9FSJ1_9DELT|nr:HEPN domain-containing protein [SAR324 cluster bacterium]